MLLSDEEIKTLKILLQSPVEDNVRVAFAILAGKEYPKTIKKLLTDYQQFYTGWGWKDLKDEILSIEEICIIVNQIFESEKWHIEFHDHSLDKDIDLFQNIKYLEINSHRSKKTPSWLAKLNALESLILENIPISIKNLSDLKNLKSLKNLSIRLDTSDLDQSKLNAIATLSDLETLDIANNTIARLDFSVLASLEKLKKLTLGNCYLRQLPSKLPKQLEILEIYHNQLTKANFSALLSLTNLKSLRLSNCQLKKLPSEISKIIQLEELDLSINTISSYFPALAPLKNLKKLILSKSHISHIPKNIDQLTALEELIVDNNPIAFTSNFAPLENLKNLKKLDVWECYHLLDLPPALLALVAKGITVIYGN